MKYEGEILVRRILDAIQDSTMGSAEKLHDAIMIRLLNTSKQYIKNRKYNDILADALEENKDEVVDFIIESLRNDQLNEFVDEVAEGIIEDLKKQIREEDQLKR